MYLFQTEGNVDGPQIGAVLEQIIAEIGDAVGQRYLFQAGTAIERFIIQLGNALLEAHGGQAGTAIEGSAADDCQGCGEINRGQTGTAVKGTASDLGHTIRDLDALQTDASGKGAAADGLQRLGQNDFFQIIGTGEHVSTKGRYTLWHRNALQAAAAGKDIGPAMGLGQTCRIVDALKTGAVLEQIIAEIGDAVGQLYFGQAGTAIEGLIIQLGDCIRQIDEGQTGAAIEGSAADRCYRCGNRNSSDRALGFKQSTAQLPHNIAIDGAGNDNHTVCAAISGDGGIVGFLHSICEGGCIGSHTIKNGALKSSDGTEFRTTDIGCDALIFDIKRIIGMIITHPIG